MSRQLPAAIALALVAGTLAPAQEKKAADGDAAKAVAEASEAWARAEIKSDVEAMRRLMADDYVMIDPAGEVTSKADEIESIRNGKLKFDAIESSDAKVRVYGDSAVVTGKSKVRGKYEDHDIGGTYRYTEVYVRRDGRWQVVSAHVSTVMTP